MTSNVSAVLRWILGILLAIIHAEQEVNERNVSIRGVYPRTFYPRAWAKRTKCGSDRVGDSSSGWEERYAMVAEVMDVMPERGYTLGLVWMSGGGQVILEDRKRVTLHGEGVLCGAMEGHDVWSFLSPPLSAGNFSVRLFVQLGEEMERPEALGMYVHDFLVFAPEDRGEDVCSGEEEGGRRTGKLKDAVAIDDENVSWIDNGTDAVRGDGGKRSGPEQGGSRAPKCGEKDGPQKVDVSIVLSARNDGHGDAAAGVTAGATGSFLSRLKNTLELLSKYSWSEEGVTVEIILVSWADAPEGGKGAALSLMEALGYVGRARSRQAQEAEGQEPEAQEREGQAAEDHAGESEYVAKTDYWHDAAVVLRFIVVPEDVQASLYNPLALGLPQYVSKNVGMRRACGRWLVVTNADCLLSYDLLRFIAHTALETQDDDDSHETQHPHTHADAQALLAQLQGARPGAQKSKKTNQKAFYLARRKDLPGVPSNGFPFEEVVLIQNGVSSWPLTEVVSPEGCVASRISGNVYRGTKGLMGILNIGDFFFARHSLVTGAYGYSEHQYPFGLDGEFVCRLAFVHAAEARFVGDPCFVLHQHHPHAYNFSHPSFPWQATCEAYEAGLLSAPKLPHVPNLTNHVSPQWGLSKLALSEVEVQADGALLRRRALKRREPQAEEEEGAVAEEGRQNAKKLPEYDAGASATGPSAPAAAHLQHLQHLQHRNGSLELPHWLDRAAAGQQQYAGGEEPSAASGETSKRAQGAAALHGDAPWWFRSYAAFHARIRGGQEAARYAVWTCQPLGAGTQTAGEAGEGAHAKDAPWKQEDVYSSPDDTVGPRPSRAAGGFNGCTGYGNRLYGVATALLYALVTDRALLIQWPGHAEQALEHFMLPAADAFDWRPYGLHQELEQLSATYLDDRVSRTQFRTAMLARDLREEHTAQAVYLTCNEAFFVDLLHNPYHRARLEELHLWRGEQVFALLSRVLEPSALVRQAAVEVLAPFAECKVLAIQVRTGTEQTSPYAILDASELQLLWEAAQQLKDTLLVGSVARGSCVRFLISSDDASVVQLARAALGHDEVLWYEGQVTHIDTQAATRLELLKIFTDHYLLSLADEILITIPSSFGFTARMFNRTGATHLYAFVSARYRQVSPRVMALHPRAATAAYDCGGRDACFCGTVGVAGDLCPKLEGGQDGVGFILVLHHRSASELPQPPACARGEARVAHTLSVLPRALTLGEHAPACVSCEEAQPAAEEDAGRAKFFEETKKIEEQTKIAHAHRRSVCEKGGEGEEGVRDSRVVVLDLSVHSQVYNKERLPLAIGVLAAHALAHSVRGWGGGRGGRGPSEEDDSRRTRAAAAEEVMLSVWMEEEEVMALPLHQACSRGTLPAVAADSLTLAQDDEQAARRLWETASTCELAIVLPCQRLLLALPPDAARAEVSVGAMITSRSRPGMRHVVEVAVTLLHCQAP